MKRGIEMTAAQVEEHQRKHGFIAESPSAVPTGRKLPTPVKMSRPEKEYDLILKIRSARLEIASYKFQGMSLAWGADPKTGRLMRYKGDFVVFELNGTIKIIEVKGGHITQEGMARFKGCRAEWPQFDFEMMQLTKEGWRRIQ